MTMTNSESDTKMQELAKLCEQQIREGFGGWHESYGTNNINVRNDEYEISELYRNDTDPTYHFTRAQTERMNKSHAHMMECFARDHLDMTDAEAIENLSYDDLTPAQQEKLADYENEWFEPCLLRITIQDFCNRGEISIGVGINYSDAPYYRGDDEVLFKREYDAEEFARVPNEQIVADIVKAISG